MLTIIILCYLLVEFELALIGKFELKEKFKNYAMKGKSKLIYKLSNCDFCIHFHLCVISTILLTVLIDFNIIYLLTPVFTSGLKRTMNGTKN